MPKVSTGKPTQAAWATASSFEIEEVSVEAAPRIASTPTPKRPAEGLMSQHEDFDQAHKRVKVSVGKHKSQCDEGSSWMYSKDKEPVALGGEPVPPTYCRSKSIKVLRGTIMCKNDERYHALTVTDLPPWDLDSEMQARRRALKSSVRV
ncbi:hypothetical protein BHE74_00038111 [Ensete ventricosum]|nr:hypothetical protein BHE74_00038111 [Ensete ventricosum]